MQKTRERGLHGLTESTAQNRQQKGHLSVGSLVLVGVGGIIGAGFFLGCGLPISLAGPAVLLSFVLAAFITAVVTGSITSIAVNHPIRGSFQVYASMYIGPFAGFMQGWTFYLTGILTIASESVAMAIFTRMWLPNIPVALLAGVFSAVVIIINAFGARNFERVEAWMSVVKIAALVGFICIMAAALFGLFAHHGTIGAAAAGAAGGWIPHGFKGIAQSMLIVLFAYAGIGVFAAAAPDVRHPRDIDKAALWTLLILTVLYILSIGLLLWAVPWHTFGTSASPFVVGLQKIGLGWIPMILNGVILIAAFSVMAGSLYAADEILLSLAASKDAPKIILYKTKRGIAVGALVTSTIAIALVLFLSQMLPANVYNFLISASSDFTLFNWFILMWAFLRWAKTTKEDDAFTSVLAFGHPYTTWVVIILIIALAGYSLTQSDQRIGFFAALGVGILVALCYLFVRRSQRA